MQDELRRARHVILEYLRRRLSEGREADYYHVLSSTLPFILQRLDVLLESMPKTPDLDVEEEARLFTERLWRRLYPDIPPPSLGDKPSLMGLYSSVRRRLAEYWERIGAGRRPSLTEIEEEAGRRALEFTAMVSSYLLSLVT